MELQNFFPYQLSCLAESVSLATALVYEHRFNLSRDEWRILATLGEIRTARTGFLKESTSLDKMRVSRALARLENDGLVTREEDPEDRRGYLIGITPAGQALYRKIVPKVLAREEYLLEALEPSELETLKDCIDKIYQRSTELRRQG